MLKSENKNTILNSRGWQFIIESIVLLAFVLGLVFLPSPALAQSGTVRFASIGDYGADSANELEVANLVKSWNPDFIITLGDNNYPSGEAADMDRDVGKYYQEFIYPYFGTYGTGATVNKFFPSLGNHDWDNNIGAPIQPYKDYFTLPNNERYYDFVQGPVHFFVLDSDDREPDGNTSTSIQAQWLQAALAASTAQWKIVYFHHTPFSSRTSTPKMQWPFQAWGATATIGGHSHVYERVMRNGFPYFTNGVGGESLGAFGTPISGSAVRYSSNYGAQLITASSNSINFQFISVTGLVVDSYTISIGAVNPPTDLSVTNVTANQINLAWVDNSDNEAGFNVERCQNSGCTNFAAVGTALPNTSSYIDNSVSANTTYVYRVRGYSSGNNSDYTNTLQVTTSSTGNGTVLADNFDDNIRDATKWNVGLFSRASTHFDRLVTVNEQTQQLMITPRASTSGNHYNGYTSASTWNLTDSTVTVELAQKPSGLATAVFAIGFDRDNWYQFRVKGSTIYYEDRRLASTTTTSASYNASQHRFLRFRHNPTSNSIIFETSVNGNSWTARRTVSRQIAINSSRIDLIAGTSESVSSPGSAKFDNFSIESSNAAPPPSLPSPSALIANGTSENTIALSWTDNSSNENIFKIERCLSNGCTNFAQVATVSAEVTTFNDTGLLPISNYRYRVRASNSTSDSSYSNISETMTFPPTPVPPNAPSNLIATASSSSQIHLQWHVNSENEDGFKIERCTNSGCTNFVEIAQVGSDVDYFYDNGLTAEATFAYRVYAFNVAGNSSYSNSSEAMTLPANPPNPPSDLGATPISLTQINLVWTDNSGNESGFKIERCQNTACVDFAQVALLAANSTTFSDTDLPSSTLFRYRVRAANIAGDSQYSNIADAQTLTPFPPNAPSLLGGSTVSPTQIDLSWTDNSNDETGFKIERCQDSGCINFVEVAQVGANVSTYNNSSLLPSTTYRYQVRAFNTDGDSGYSNIADATTLAIPPPNAPSDLMASPISTSQINLAWTDNSSDEDGFRIERCQSSGCTNFTEIAQVGINSTAFNDLSLPPGTTFRYQVRAFKSTINSSYSNIAVSATFPLTPPTPPSGLSAVATSSTQIQLAWTDNSSNETAFKIERCQNSDCVDFVEIAQVNADVVSYNDTNRSPSTTFRYRVRAYKPIDGDSDYSNIASATTPASPFLMLVDDFNDNVRDTTKWNVGFFSRDASNLDPLILVSEANSRLNVTPRNSVSTASYNGYVSVATWNFNDSRSSVEVVQKSSGNAVTKLSVGIDKNNWYGIRAAGTTLYLEYRRLAVTTTVTITYSATQHRFWGIRHDPLTDTVIMETSPDGVVWTSRYTVAREFSLAAFKAELIAGTSSSAPTPSAAIFDNFRLAPNAAP